MLNLSGKQLIFIGILLVTQGCLVPFAIVMGYFETSFLLAFLTYGGSVVGLALGIIGAAKLNLQRKQKEEKWK